MVVSGHVAPHVPWLVFVATLAVAPPQTVHAQDSGGTVKGFEFEVVARERRLYPRQFADLVRFREARSVFHVDLDSTAQEPYRRTLSLSFRRAESGDGAALTVDSAGRAVGVSTRLTPVRSYWLGSPSDSVWQSHLDYFTSAGRPWGFSLPEQRTWDLVPVVPPGSLRAGERWVDTLSLEAREGEFAQMLSGTRTTTVLRDTLVGGVPMWLLRDSAEVTATDRFLTRERTLDDLAVVERTGQGLHQGRFLYDPELRLYRERWDTTDMAGEEVVTLPDGRAFATPVRVQRTREIHLRDSLDAAEHRAELQAESRRRRVGMLILPSDSLQERLVEGEAGVIDSLLNVVRTGADPVGRRAALDLLLSWGRPDAATARTYEQLSLAMGDTARYLVSLRDRLLGWQIPFTVEELDHALPLMVDPGLAHAFGLEEEPYYENVRQGLLARPPAVTPDTASWTCEPAACRLLERQWWEAQEPRLRELGLVALFAADPASWADTVLALGDGSPFLAPAVLLARGVGSTWPASLQLPMPGPEAGWRDWSRWMTAQRPGSPGDQDQVVRFGDTHRVAIRMAELHTGRDIVAELGAQAREAVGDTAVVVYSTLLSGLGAATPDPETVARYLTSDSPELRLLAQRQLSPLFAEAEAADDALAAEVVNRLLAVLLEGEDPWPELHPGELRVRDLSGGGGHREEDARLLLRDGDLPPGVRESWEGRVEILGAGEVLPPREASTLVTVGPVLQAGRFLRLGADYTTRLERGADESPGGFAGGFTVYLFLSDEGWRIVAVGMWIT